MAARFCLELEPPDAAPFEEAALFVDADFASWASAEDAPASFPDDVEIGLGALVVGIGSTPGPLDRTCVPLDCGPEEAFNKLAFCTVADAAPPFAPRDSKGP